MRRLLGAVHADISASENRLLCVTRLRTQAKPKLTATVFFVFGRMVSDD
jgi:hypothetical protein